MSDYSRAWPMAPCSSPACLLMISEPSLATCKQIFGSFTLAAAFTRLRPMKTCWPSSTTLSSHHFGRGPCQGHHGGQMSSPGSHSATVNLLLAETIEARRMSLVHGNERATIAAATRSYRVPSRELLRLSPPPTLLDWRRKTNRPWSTPAGWDDVDDVLRLRALDCGEVN
jgi:hypothetical protein